MSAVPTPNINSPAWSLYVDQQNVTLITGDGTPLNISLQEINENFYFDIEIAISYAFAVGVTSILMIVLLILADKKKARHPVFVLNFLALFFLCIKGIINLAGECSQWAYGVGEVLFQTQAQYASTSVLGINTLFLLLDLIIYPLVLASLILQIRIVFAATPQTRLFVTLFLVAGALFMYSTLFADTVWLLQLLYGSPQSFNNFTLVFNMYNISFVVFVGICSFLFIYKLVVTIQRRKSMGFKSFGPLHVLAIVFGQCLIVPVILLIIQLAVANDRFSLTTITLTILVASLPISLIWASHVAELAGRNGNTTTSSVNSNNFSARLRFWGDKKQPSSFSDAEKTSNLSEAETAKRPNSLDVSQLSPVNEV